MAVTHTTIILLTIGLCEAAYNICPANSINSTHSTFGTSKYVQRGLWHQVPCPSFRPDEAISRVIWYKQDSPTTPAQTLITHKRNTDYPESDMYAFGKSGFSLVIKGVQESDGGRYVCQVAPRDTLARDEAISIQVIGETFPGGSSQASSTASFQRGRRQTLPCECASQTPDVVYWSTGEGVTIDTQIIGARFSDGATLQIQYGADYCIGSDASLTVNSLNDVQDTQRFWCHVFQSNGSLRNCNTGAKISVEAESTSNALKASERYFFLRKDTQQILPCLSWTPGDTACEVEWSKLDNPDRQVLSYNLSTGVVDSSPEFDLVSDFGLVIQSVEDDHAGVFRCALGDKNKIDVEVRVIGDRFPLDEANATEGDSVTIKPESRFSLRCPALSDISLTTKSTLFWSFGAPDAESTTVIGTMNLPDGPIKMSDLGDNSCLGISIEGALLLNNCSQDGDVRYWCHVFPANGDLIRSYVGVLMENSNGAPGLSHVVAIGVCVPLCVIILLGVFRLVGKREPVLKKLAKKIKSFVIIKFERIPITPWVDAGDVCFASIDSVYKPLEMFVNVSHGGSTVKYKLHSESGIFDDGIPELASKHAIIQGRRGCGKTTFLHRLIYDWAIGRERALWGRDQIVVLIPAWLLIKSKTIGEVVVECMIPKDANISAESINAHYARDKRNLTILVDDCNGKDDIDAVIEFMTVNGFLGCHLIVTTRNSKFAKAASRKHNMRIVTISGFSFITAIEYINVVLDTAEDNKKSTPEHTAVKSKAKPTSDSIPLETKASTSTAGYPEIETPKTATTKQKRNIHRYIEEHILQPDISCLPAVLAALCQLSIWTKGDAFKPDVTMSYLFRTLVKCRVNKKGSLEEGVTEGNQLRDPMKDKLKVITELGRVAHSRLIDSYEDNADFSTEDFLNASGNEDHILDDAIQLGLLRPLLSESQVESAEQSIEVSKVKNRRAYLCCKRKEERGTKPDPMREDIELALLTSPRNKRVYFVLEILEELCVAQFFAETTERVEQWVDGITEIGHTDILQRLSNVFQFAIQAKKFDREALVNYFAKIIVKEYRQARLLHELLQMQNFVELCLQLNFEGQCEGALNKKLKSVFPDGRVRLIGISSYKLRLLSYLLEHAQPDDRSKLNVKSIELLRIGQHDWSELNEYIEHFVHGQKVPELKTEHTKTEESQPSTTEIYKGTVPSSQEDIEELRQIPPPIRSHPSESEHNNPIQKEVQSTKSELQPGRENKCDEVSLSTQSESDVGDSSSEACGNEDESISKPRNVDIESCDIIDIENEQAVLKKLRERIKSSNQDMPRFPPDESDISVLHTVQSFGLQELLESQAGECYSSGAARDLARYLPRLEMLESLVLVGTILSSEAISDLARNADQLPNLKKLDLRLNKQFDDRAFVAVTSLLLRKCNNLTDLRLSLCRVQDKGFDEVQREMEKDGAVLWGRLKTLYLLHGSPAEKFAGFLSHSLKYFHFVECLHVSATYKSEEIRDEIQGEFEQNMKNQKIMTNLEDLDIGNMETLKARLAPLDLPKKRKGSGLLPTFGTAVIDMGKRTAIGLWNRNRKQTVSESEKSAADTMSGPTRAVSVDAMSDLRM
ncbi:uncharacterized protein LOC119732008 [Patiria miniata]|uniref:Ig-like domain-containing protein n=1 Tax=Patiria miniata TaxID=46514 RepID=A0A914AD67_PATMI|nr:uncharacterized protein LOC119732008 [Patiria miniata]